MYKEELTDATLSPLSILKYEQKFKMAAILGIENIYVHIIFDSLGIVSYNVSSFMFKRSQITNMIK